MCWSSWRREGDFRRVNEKANAEEAEGTEGAEEGGAMDAGQLDGVAEYFRAIRVCDPGAGPQYDVLADAIVWPDELPAGRFGACTCIRFVWRSRTCRLIGLAPEYEEWWRRALELFPEWIGFLPERNTASTELTEMFHQWRAASMESFERFLAAEDDVAG